MKPIKVEQENLKEAIKNGQSYIQVDDKKYLLLEVDEINQNENYVVSDPVEEKKLLDALNKHNPILTEDEINKMLKR
ncbi:hypothetical protein CIL03_16190 [Virgibacillus indicus]|uniref:Uncharacterized protein n=1 Tax=Virgibacillus indicus TaxID=2024554 RepID=A0A265N711_9BACI|nr:hypothetical protein [Virgibacillus indicus]OZU87627.1 hypothetical protein CIL03_16190 [Virgibacillus indicus]